MNSSNKMVKVMDGFVKDENGKFHTIPMKFPECMMRPPSANKNEETRSTVRRKFIPIQPLVLTPADFEESPQNATKKRKIDRPVRKELFKVPQKRLSGRLSAGNRRSVTSSLSMNKSKRNIKNTNSNKWKAQNEGCALLDINEAEELFSKEKSVKNPIKTVLFPIDKTEKKFNEVTNGRTPPLKTCAKNEITPNSTDSAQADLEFLELEKQVASATKSKKVDTASPVTSVCALLEGTRITSSGKKGVNRNSILSEILSLIREDKEKFEAHRQNCVRYEQEHEKRQNKIIELLTSLEEDKENNRRSLRIASQNVKTKFVVSPAIASKVDLRKTTLNKNLSKNLQYESPTTQKAVDMYNLMRSDCSVLCTPKLDKSVIDLPQGSVRRSLSRRIQKQCLLLQDTPRPS